MSVAYKVTATPTQMRTQAFTTTLQSCDDTVTVTATMWQATACASISFQHPTANGRMVTTDTYRPTVRVTPVVPVHNLQHLMLRSLLQMTMDGYTVSRRSVLPFAVFKPWYTDVTVSPAVATAEHLQQTRIRLDTLHRLMRRLPQTRLRTQLRSRFSVTVMDAASVTSNSSDPIVILLYTCQR